MSAKPVVVETPEKLPALTPDSARELLRCLQGIQERRQSQQQHDLRAPENK